jgi:hypothetical protein
MEKASNSSAGSEYLSKQHYDSQSEQLTQSNDSWTWKVTNLRTVPTFHPLECTAVVLKDIPLEEISARISTFMRMNSIYCSYQSEMGHVDCLTSCLLKFGVQLWRSDSDKDEDVVLEVSRLQGCSIGMQRIRNCLVYAVITGERATIPQLQGTGAAKCPPSRALTEMYERYVATTGGVQEEGYCEGALLIAVKLLESNCFDQNRLGMESLRVLTNPTTVCEGDADWVAKAIVFGNGKYGIQMQSLLTKYFQNIERPERSEGGGSGFMNDSSDECGFLEYAKGCSFGIMHNFGLRVLTNSLERLVTRKSNNGNDMVDLSCSFWKTVLPALIYNMEVAEHRPHEASLSARCIGLLDILEPVILNHFKEDGLLPIAIHAHEFGKIHHLTLEQESGNLIKSLS